MDRIARGFRLVAFASSWALAASCSTLEAPGEDFVSDNPNAGGDGGGWGGDDGAPGGDEGGDDSGDGDDGSGEEVIREADIIHLDGNRLYALSRLGGLAIVDVSTRDELPILGRYRVRAQPFEMYVEGTSAFIMYTDFGSYDYDEELNDYIYRENSRLMALDASDPHDIVLKGEFALPGRISDSRRVGDILYLVTYEDGYCWGCQDVPNTTVTSLDISDVAHPTTVDQLVFEGSEYTWGGGERSVFSTTDRMYVASQEWGDGDESRSTIDVIDITDPGGAMVQGASFQAAGAVTNRWQMDEFEDVFRVISQPDIWSLQYPPVVETFTVVSSSELTPLGSLDMTLPREEQLRSVRFDGTRAYAITFERTDPLFSIDLTDPAAPQQLGELEIPGWVYHMEPRGDRLLGLGYDQSDPDGSINVSLFDVSDLNTPTLMERVSFGGDWAQFPEGQNQIHKAFTILEDENLLLIPYSGWSYDEGEPCLEQYRSGVQLVDFTVDTLVARGVADVQGDSRRAFMDDERLFSVGDRAVDTFDIADRDAPELTAHVALATPVDRSVVAGSYLVRLSSSWWRDMPYLEVVALADAGAAEPLGRLDLGEVAAEIVDPVYPEDCPGYYLYDAELFVREGYVYLVFPYYSYEGQGKEAVAIAVIDIRDPATPTFVRSLDLPIALGWGGDGFAGFGTGDKRIVQAGSNLVLHRNVVDWDDNDARTSTAAFEIVDLSDPANPEHVATLERPDAFQHGALVVFDDIVASWHAKAVTPDASKIAFYLERLDLGDPGDPVQRTPVNVPGVVIGYNDEEQRAVTVGFQIEQDEDIAEEDCWQHPKAMYYEGGACWLLHHLVDLVEIDGDSASRLATVDVEEDRHLGSAMGSSELVFAQIDDGGMYWGDGADVAPDGPGGGPGAYEGPHSDLVVIPGLAGGDFEVASRTDMGPWFYLGGARTTGQKLVVDVSEGLAVVDASDTSSVSIEIHELYGYGCYHLEIAGDNAYCSLGEFGLQVVPLSAP